jgi:hypothetical protein
LNRCLCPRGRRGYAGIAVTQQHDTKLICIFNGDETMAKEQHHGKEEKKKSELTLKEKRAAKKAKKEKNGA